jgi:predicted amidohydrolase
MRPARDAEVGAGADLVLFPKGAMTSPHKRVVSSRPDVVAAADWSMVDRDALDAELDAVARLAGDLGLWTVVGGMAFDDDDGDRPFNSLFVFSNRGALVGRYDERMLSNTKASFMYRRGSGPLVFDAVGLRIGCTLGMESWAWRANTRELLRL